jgi:hypothetical protein
MSCGEAVTWILLVCLTASHPSVDYLVVTPGRLAPAFSDFVHWKTRKGLWTELVPTETILTRTPGRDPAERLRNFVRRWHDSLSTKWLLLAGDTAGVPIRLAATPGNITEFSPCDLYFSDLDRDWDANQNNVFGEEADSVDMLSDINVGRAIVTDTSTARALVRKWLEFELGPNPDYLRKLLLAGDSVNLTLPPNWFLGRLSSPPSRRELPDSINAGFQFVSHVGHSDGTMLLVGTQLVLDLTDVASLQNAHRANLFLTVGSQAGATDRPSIGTALLARPDAGSVAVLANSRAGWLGRSELLGRFFLNRFFSSDTCREVGRNFAGAKDVFVPLARNDRYWRQTLYVWHLLGEPSLPCWKDTARTLEVSHPFALDTGRQDFPIQVRSGGMSARACVCLWQGDEVYERRWIQDSGSINIHPRTPGELLVTVTGPDYRPYLGSCGIATPLADHRQTPLPRLRCFQTLAGIVIETKGATSVQVLDATGRCELHRRLFGPHARLELALSPGVKFLLCHSAAGPVRRKLVLVR